MSTIAGRLPSKKWLITLSLAVLLVLSIINPLTTRAFAGLGGYIGEKLLGDGVNNYLSLGDGTNTQQILGSAPVLSTGAATSGVVGGVYQATLSGTVQNLNGMPQADVWFEWGYAPGFLVNTTPILTVASTGSQSVLITGLTPGMYVYYRVVSSTDGTSYGNVVSFISGGDAEAGFNLLAYVLPIIIAAVVILFVWMYWGSGAALILAGIVVGFLALRIALVFIQNIFH